ncbi:pyruvate kinase [Parafannyhessea umbonata]|jgi:pyruvate kinase|uniref:Pyruvate kinase n=1 Tax=Parafannyhessea umbonata TaxID=604330 RepID=A0A6N7WSN9_9ACTN|nr:pyruvate kinase [Parafannyhessea umbonata]MCI6682661.1 pyruvate kinase [Parafannyhessea umbonata]MCI7218234.1 pyruvate kinase [Parafannyhessea umbonata]MDD6358717.1 pyruvate kinase [Parafannyhessea umbonata]MDD6565743.1 pyruvate kinase [Parafannyhessea umbonata]MDD6602286.1 pyruvate kinase [Parafannyhessea umbonata]
MSTKRTKIVCTMGPATESDEVLRELIKNGMNVARFNFSHGSHAYHRQNIERVRSISEELGIPVAIMLDTKGPEVRTGLLEGGQKVTVNTGDKIVVTAQPTTEDWHGNAGHISLDYLNLPNEVEKGSVILIDDGLVGLEVDHVEGNDMHCVVTNGGEIGEKKGVNVPNVEIGLPSVTEQDIADIMFGCELGIDAIAASFIRNAQAVDEIRKLCADNGLRNVYIFPKIESALGVKNFDEILAASDGCMVARGDLGVEIPAQEVPHIQKIIIKKCAQSYKPVITATQMLDSMIRNPRPTRAEVNDVANAIYDGTDCVMLSGETAAGKYPVEAVKMMASICRETEKYLPERREYHDRGGMRNVNSAIGLAAAEVADRVNAKCIICPTHSGRTSRLISNFRPRIPIVAMSPSNHAVRKTCFQWGVDAYKTTEQGSLSATCYNALTVAKENGVVDTGDLVVVTAGDPQTSPSQGDYITSTNMAMVSQIQ